MRKTTQLKKLIESKELSFLMEAHSGLSAKIVEEAGFAGIWGSGLSMSAAMGVRDNNEVSWTQVVEAAEYMCDSTTIPMLLDGDTGHGNFNNMRRFVRKLEQRGVAGVCIEDKIFPKTNSFLRGEQQPLAQMEEFCGKIKAGLDARHDGDFCIVARVEALIAGWGMEEALKRAHAYADAGASAILIHSQRSDAEEILQFMQRWDRRCPVVIVPTKYYATPTELFRQHGVSTVIWANHLLRSSIVAMQTTAATIKEQQSLIDVEDAVAPLREVFRLQNDEELVLAEKLYFGQQKKSSAIILAAGHDEELSRLTTDRPKALLEVQGKPILVGLIEKMKNIGINDFHVVCGYKKEAFPPLSCQFIENKNYTSTSELYSLALAKKALQQQSGDLYISYGDIIFRSYILTQLQESSAPITLVVDKNLPLPTSQNSGRRGDYVQCTQVPVSMDLFLTKRPSLLRCALAEISQLDFTPNGEWVGLMKVNEVGGKILLQALEELMEQEQFSQLKIGDLLNFLVQKDVEMAIEMIDGHWMDVDNYLDYVRAQAF